MDDRQVRRPVGMTQRTGRYKWSRGKKGESVNKNRDPGTWARTGCRAEARLGLRPSAGAEDLGSGARESGDVW